jgi:hypothetical protein
LPVIKEERLKGLKVNCDGIRLVERGKKGLGKETKPAASQKKARAFLQVGDTLWWPCKMMITMAGAGAASAVLLPASRQAATAATATCSAYILSLEEGPMVGQGRII